MRGIEYPPREELERQWPVEIFDRARALLFDVIWLKLPTEERRDEVASRAFTTEERLSELIVVWERLREGRIDQVEWNRRRDELEDALGLGGYTTGTGAFPELDALYRERQVLERQVALDFKSLYVFGDLVLDSYVWMSEPVWDAPSSIIHHEGLGVFVNSVRRAQKDGVIDADSEFSLYLSILFQQMQAVEESFGWYRNKWVVHIPADMERGASEGITVPLSFNESFHRQGEVAEAQLRRLRRTIRQVEKAEGLALGNDEPDPRPKLRKLAVLLPTFHNQSSVTTVQNLLLEWGVESPPVLPTAGRLARLLDDWSTAFLRRVGQMTEADFDEIRQRSSDAQTPAGTEPPANPRASPPESEPA